MHTLFDFITRIKGVEYLIAVSSIGMFLVLWEVLKPHPFRSVIDTAREDAREIRLGGGYVEVLRTAGHVAAAPFIGLGYIVALPFVFTYAVGSVFIEAIARAAGTVAVLLGRTFAAGSRALGTVLHHVSPSFGWHPQEAYFLGRRKQRRADKEGGTK
jgi:hypothetical protein